MMTPEEIIDSMITDDEETPKPSPEFLDVLKSLSKDENAHMRENDVLRVWYYLGSGMASITPETKLLAPILISLFEHPQVPNKLWILEALAGAHFHVPFCQKGDFYNYRIALEIYLLLFEKFTQISAYLNHPRELTRFAVLAICSRFIFHPDVVAPKFLQQLQVERSANVQTRLLTSLGRLLYLSPQTDSRLKEEVSQGVKPFLQSDNVNLRLDACTALIYIYQESIVNDVRLSMTQAIIQICEKNKKITNGMDTDGSSTIHLRMAIKTLSTIVQAELLNEFLDVCTDTSLQETFHKDLDKLVHL